MHIHESDNVGLSNNTLSSSAIEIDCCLMFCLRNDSTFDELFIIILLYLNGVQLDIIFRTLIGHCKSIVLSITIFRSYLVENDNV